MSSEIKVRPIILSSIVSNFQVTGLFAHQDSQKQLNYVILQSTHSFSVQVNSCMRNVQTRGPQEPVMGIFLCIPPLLPFFGSFHSHYPFLASLSSSYPQLVYLYLLLSLTFPSSLPWQSLPRNNLAELSHCQTLTQQTSNILNNTACNLLPI